MFVRLNEIKKRFVLIYLCLINCQQIELVHCFWTFPRLNDQHSMKIDFLFSNRQSHLYIEAYRTKSFLDYLGWSKETTRQNALFHWTKSKKKNHSNSLNSSQLKLLIKQSFTLEWWISNALWCRTNSLWFGTFARFCHVWRSFLFHVGQGIEDKSHWKLTWIQAFS